MNKAQIATFTFSGCTIQSLGWLWSIKLSYLDAVGIVEYH